MYAPKRPIAQLQVPVRSNATVTTQGRSAELRTRFDSLAYPRHKQRARGAPQPGRVAQTHCPNHDLPAGRRKADVHVVLVARPRNDDSGRSAEPRRIADEDVLRAGGDESVEEVLREMVIDLRRRGRRTQSAVAAREVGVDVEIGRAHV